MRRSANERLFWESFTKAYPVKATALLLILALVVVGCGKEGAISRSLNRLNYDSLPADAPRPTKPADKLHAAVTDLQGLLAVQAKRDLSDAQADKARTGRDRIATELRAVHRQFDADRAKLKDLGAKAALARLDEIEAKTARLERSLRSELAAVPLEGDRAGRAAARAAKLLRELSPERPEQPLSSEFGFGVNHARPWSPELSAGITPAYSSPTPTDVASELPRAPEQDDLAETPETRVTRAIRALAQQLGGDPVKIYEYVRNEIRYQPYYGIRKGADQTLAERSGSDADQAALLVALLRESRIHARFVQGVAQLPAATAASWLGVETQSGERPEAAPDILASAGIPTTQIRANGQLVKVRFDHFWAEAYVPNEAYRGVDEQLGDKEWLPLDPSIKPTEITRPAADFRALMAPIAEGLAEDFVAATSEAEGDAILAPDADELGSIMAESNSRLKSLIRDQGVTADWDASDIIGGTEIRQATAPYLPSTLPAQVLAVSAEARAIPAILQSRVTFRVSGSDPLSLPDPDLDAGAGGLSFIAPTSELANKRITLAYVPASVEDAEIIDTYHGLLNAPSYAASLIPVLRVDGRVVARGRTAVSTGYTQSFEITYRSPGYAADTVTNPVYVGSLSAVGLDLGTISGDQLGARAEALGQMASTVTAENVLTDGHGGEMLSQLAALYFLRNDAFNGALSRAIGVHQTRDLSGAITATSITPRYIGSFPVSVRFDGLTIDVDQDSQVVVDKTAADPSIDTYMRAAGMYASASESAIFEYALGWEAASTTRVLRVAADGGIPIHHVTAQNVDAELQRLQLPDAVERRIATAVARPGVEVVVPEREVTVGGWSGVGYVVSGGSSTDYRISGGISGGAAGSPGSGSASEAMAEGVSRHSERVKQASDCDEAEIVLLALAVLIVVIAMVALVYFWPASLPVFTVELFSFGMVLDAPLLLSLSLKGFVAAFVGAELLEELGECW